MSMSLKASPPKVVARRAKPGSALISSSAWPRGTTTTAGKAPRGPRPRPRRAPIPQQDHSTGTRPPDFRHCDAMASSDMAKKPTRERCKASTSLSTSSASTRPCIGGSARGKSGKTPSTKYERNNPKIQQQFADLKRALSTIADDVWTPRDRRCHEYLAREAIQKAMNWLAPHSIGTSTASSRLFRPAATNEEQASLQSHPTEKS
ncbi:hypothetical protein HRG_004311 [Hirsutella rhossiliensis]|uniref:PRP1 splicing factor N-terminal domain-containing protein n=1 Tax=Hirsutella rhossiliensis TaxID=111463 RepID=A0A9P8MXG9_9HYPO|nr:uncharacterized protein HRG_04311 [Hirsutella rhossiliensis]KAH0963883.1 hypothetical protein HRG_04311 [Hirsutella rhossiliensis]